MFVCAWSVWKARGSTSLSGSRVPRKKPILRKLLSIIVTKTTHEYAPSCAKNWAGKLTMLTERIWWWMIGLLCTCPVHVCERSNLLSHLFPIRSCTAWNQFFFGWYNWIMIYWLIRLIIKLNKYSLVRLVHRHKITIIYYMPIWLA